MTLSQAFSLDRLGEELTALSKYLADNYENLPKEEIDEILAWGKQFDELQITLFAIYLKEHPDLSF